MGSAPSRGTYIGEITDDVSLSLPSPLSKNQQACLQVRIKKKKERKKDELGLVWLSGLNAGLQTKGSPVQFLVRAHARAVGMQAATIH